LPTQANLIIGVLVGVLCGFLCSIHILLDDDHA
jgi:hypothetical protein